MLLTSEKEKMLYKNSCEHISIETGTWIEENVVILLKSFQLKAFAILSIIKTKK